MPLRGVVGERRHLTGIDDAVTEGAKVIFDAEIQIAGVNPYVTVAPELVSRLRSVGRRPLAVTVRLNSGPPVPWRTNLMPHGDGSFRLYLHGAMRRDAGVDVGDVVTIELTADLDYASHPDHVVPEWLQRAIDRDPAAQSNWAELPFSRRKEIIRYLRALQSPDARERNLATTMRALRGERIRYLGRDWSDGR